MNICQLLRRCNQMFESGNSTNIKVILHQYRLHHYYTNKPKVWTLLCGCGLAVLLFDRKHVHDRNIDTTILTYGGA